MDESSPKYTQHDGYIALPQPDEIPEREREDAMGAYLMMFAAVASALPLPIINLVAAIIYYYVNRKKSRFVHFHSLQSLLSQLPTTLMNWGLLFWSIRIWITGALDVTDYFMGYVFMTIIANILYFVFSLIAAFRSRKGRMYYFLFFGKLSYDIVFSANSSMTYKGEQEVAPSNRPPV